MRGFALPTILIASVVMLGVLTLAVTAVVTTRRALDDQYWTTLARTAAESGYEMAKACLKQSGNTVTWSSAAPLRPNTDCSGAELVPCPVTTRNPRCGVLDSSSARTTFAVPAPTSASGFFSFSVTAEAQRLRSSNGEVWARHQHAETYTVRFSVDATTTIAGSTQGFADGSSATARFNFPRGIDRGNDGTLYVSDTDNHCIRAITPAGVVSTLAGTCTTSGFADAAGAAARFNRPYEITLSPDGYLYVADSMNHRIRRIDPITGSVSTIAGTGTAGYLNHTTGTSAQFYEPEGIEAGIDGTLYVADARNNRIRVIAPSGTRAVSRLVGNTQGYAEGSGTAALFYWPYGITVDNTGTVYVTDNLNERIRKITPSGTTSLLAGSGIAGFADGTGAAAQFSSPKGLSLDAAGNLYVADNNNQRIRKVTPTGVVTTIAGSGALGYADGANSAARFNNSADLVVAPDGVIYVADSENNRIRKITQASNTPPTVIVK